MRLDKRLLLSTLNEDFENRQAFEKGDFRCPLYTMRQATEIYKRLGLNAARSIFSSAAVDYKRYADQRDLSYSDIVPRWENPNEYTPSGSELLVPYRFAADNFPSEDINTIKTAIDSLTSQINGCITLYDDTDTTLYPHYINVKRFDENFIIDQGCWSYIGHVFWNDQNLNLGPNCLSVGTIQHEFLHALGFSHEQTRADRTSRPTAERTGATTFQRGREPPRSPRPARSPRPHGAGAASVAVHVGDSGAEQLLASLVGRAGGRHDVDRRGRGVDDRPQMLGP